jgi:hypothetical protein
MGCHTWFYRKEERSIEEARKKFIAEQKDMIKSWGLMLYNPLDDCRVAYDWSDVDISNSIDVTERRIRMVEKGLCNVAVFNHQPSNDGQHLYINEKFYTCDDEMPHDTFRIGGYPETKLFSLEETLKFLEDNDGKIDYWMTKEETIEKLKEFWTKYPDGMIEFG